MTSTTSSLIFVYGTLMRGYDHPMARHLADAADYRGEASCRGRLYRISTYPGLTLSADAADIVHGDLYALPDDPALLTLLDKYEGCGDGDPQPHPYVRAMIDVMAADGVTIKAWTYVYRMPVQESSRIASGRFFEM